MLLFTWRAPVFKATAGALIRFSALNGANIHNSTTHSRMLLTQVQETNHQNNTGMKLITVHFQLSSGIPTWWILNFSLASSGGPRSWPSAIVLSHAQPINVPIRLCQRLIGIATSENTVRHERIRKLTVHEVWVIESCLN